MTWVLLAIILVCLVVIFWLWQRMRKLEILTLKKEKRLSLILVQIKEKGRISNQEVEKLLGVSDATATRYLEELEKRGEIEQAGKTGRGVYYVLKKK